MSSESIITTVWLGGLYSLKSCDPSDLRPWALMHLQMSSHGGSGERGRGVRPPAVRTYSSVAEHFCVLWSRSSFRVPSSRQPLS